MGDTEPVKVTIRGVTYPSITAAAKALGVSRAAIHQGMTKGIIDNVGLRKPPVDDAAPLAALAMKAIINDLMERMDWIGTGNQESADLDYQEFQKRIDAIPNDDALTAQAMTLPKIKALLDALMPVWHAILGPPHYIRELQAIASLPDTPLVRLRDALAALPSNPVDDKKPADPGTK